ncbi:hypothetical protein Ga0466249_004320 [Sporomusaceae bacterium BoRhaA]|uniref:transposase family protein n=1 Tax=Pelorhabdus rhamnosifermentans TaxID=2772457 RepID=UPI001C06073F|nr:transposase family protein [Pelorhabdus rhamnosifermentans]MBU2703184.1 hypothetical protein [Pelorhabdus rhamnosifermentans]
MQGHGEKFTQKHELAIIALLTTSSIAEAAKQAGIGETTLWRWLQMPEFAKRYKEAKRQAVGQAISKLQQATTIAVDTLKNVMQDNESKDSARVTAAKTVLELSFKVIELEDLQAKFEELERIVDERLEESET